MTILIVLKPLKAMWQLLIKHEIISGFLVTMLGVWAAFWLTGLSEQSTLDKATKQRLHLAVLESQYNGVKAKEIVDAYANTSILINLDRIDSSSATTVFEDTNAVLFLPHYKISLLRSYINAILTLNQTLQLHQDVLENTDYKSTLQVDHIREKVRDNAAAVLAMAFVLQEELNPYFDEAIYDHKAIKRIEDRVKYVKAKALRGEVSLSIEK